MQRLFPLSSCHARPTYSRTRTARADSSPSYLLGQVLGVRGAGAVHVTNRPKSLDLRRKSGYVVRLLSTGGMFIVGGRKKRLVGKLRDYHYSLGMKRYIWCYYNNCRYCERGWPRSTRYETRLLLELPDGTLEERTAFLSTYEHGKFAKVAERIDELGLNPMDVRIRWNYKPGTPRTIEVVILG